MSLTGTLRTAMTGLATAQRALNVTAHNVANATTEGYVRKVHVQQAIAFDGRGAGVRSEDARRVVDEFLGAELRLQAGRLARSETLANLLGDAQSRVFGAPGESGRGVADRLAGVAAAVESLANDPAKPPLRTLVTGAVSDLTREIGRAADQIQALRRDADRRVGQIVAAVNTDVAGLYRINQELARGQSNAELEDQRDALLLDLSRKIDITTYSLDDGRVAIYMRGGQALLEGAPRILYYDPAAVIDTTTIFGPISLYAQGDVDPVTGAPLSGAAGVEVVSGGLRAELPPELVTGTPADAAMTIRSPFAGGELQGLLEARDRYLPELSDQLAEFARITAYALNAAHNRGVAQPPPSSLTGSRIEDGTFDAASRGGTAWLGVVDRSTGDVVRTVAIDVSADLATLVGQLDGDLAGYGDAEIDATGRLAVSVGAGYAIAMADGDGAVTVVDALGHTLRYGFSHYFGLNDLVVADPDQPTELDLRADIAADPALLATARLDVDAGPPPSASLGGSGDPRGAQDLAAALHTSVPTVPRGQLGVTSATLGDYAADLVATTAVTVQQAAAMGATDRAMVDDLESRAASVSGVNMDEELARLILYQQGYQVSARIVQITNQLFDELVNLGR